IDDLERVVAENLRARSKEAEAAEGIIREEVIRFTAWLRAQGVTPIIKDLRARAEDIVRAELARTLPAIDPKSHAKVEAMANAIAQKLLHAPLSAMKQDEELAPMARRLFDLRSAPEEPEPPVVVAALAAGPKPDEE